MKDFPFFGNEHDVITPGRADICNTIIEATTEEITGYGCPGVLPGEYNSETIVSDFVRKYICYESVRKKRFTKP